MTAKVAAVIPVKDKLELTQHVVEQLAAEGVPVIILDNGSTDGTVEWLDSTDLMWLHMDGANIHEMWNRGIDVVLSAWPNLTAVAILNNDLDLGPGAVTTCAKVLELQPRFAAVCPNYDGREMQARTVQVTTGICSNRYDGTGGLAGFAMVIARDFLDGYRFPENLTWWYGDDDLLLSVMTAGRWCGIVSDATVEHLDGGGQTGDWQSPEMLAVTAADEQAFRSKWVK